MSEPFTFDRFLALPRLSALRLSPDGSRLVVAVAGPAPDGKSMRTALWQIDPAGAAPPRRLTRSAAGESVPVFLHDGSLLFTSTRPDPDAKPDPDKKIAALWLLPAEGGEARLLVAPEGGVDGVVAARNADAIAFGAALHPAAASLQEDAERASKRKEAGVGALLFEDYPIRHWDDWLAPRRRRIFAANLAGADTALEPKDLTGDVGPVFVETGLDISPDGKTVVTTWRDMSRLPATPEDVVLIDVESGERRTITGGDAMFGSPAFSPDGRFIACVRFSIPTPKAPPQVTLWLLDVASGEGRDLTPDLDVWPESPVWADDSSAVFFTADQAGASAAYRVEIAGGSITRLATGEALTDLCPTPDGTTVYAMANSVARPPHVVRFGARAADQTPEPLANAIDDGFSPPNRVERLCATAEDGTSVESWLVLPPDASAEKPAPLIVWVHGGPLGSWNGWHWRWNPHLLVERGYAILMPDPALSIGYGQKMIDRGWGQWHGTPYRDVMTALDGALERPDVDASRTALMGGSYGGYMANWVAGQTDRFKAIVTHASLWNLVAMYGATDEGVFMEQEIGDPVTNPDVYAEQSPSTHVTSIKTPMLVIHGERDFRVPLGEGLSLWTQLRRFGVPAKFLYFPDENHWIQKPQNARVWYETVLAFIDQYVLDKEWVRPELL